MNTCNLNKTAKGIHLYLTNTGRKHSLKLNLATVKNIQSIMCQITDTS